MGSSMEERAEPGLPTTPAPLPSGRHSTPNTRANAEVLELTLAERWHELGWRWHEDDERFHLSNMKASAGIDSRDAHVSIQQTTITELHRELGRIIDGLDKPGSEGPTLAALASKRNRSAADLAAAAAVDTNVLQRHFGRVGPLSKVAYLRVIRAIFGAKAMAA